MAAGHLYGILPIAVIISLMIAGCPAECFTVAVYEHLDPARDSAKPLDQRMLDSVSKYEEQAHRAAQQEVHLLVFPEYGVTGTELPLTRETFRSYLQIIPHLKVDSSQQWLPCLETDTGFNVTIIHRLSCTARESGVVLVANMGTILLCFGQPLNGRSCPKDGAYYFNTDIAFDSDGTVLALYHKINTYLEPLFDTPPYTSEDVGITFTTSEATFGLIICFDIVWRHPLVTLVRNGVRHIIQSTAWIDGLPYMTSVQSQMAAAVGLNITLVAANLHMFPNDRGGSGIYSGERGILNYTYGPLTEGRLVVADLESDVSIQLKRDHDEINYDDIIYNDLSTYTLREVVVTEDRFSGSLNATNGNLTCYVRYEFEAPTQVGSTGRYYLAAYQGVLVVGNQTYRMAIENCAMLWCADGDQPLTTCARPQVNSSQARLTHLVLDGKFTTSYVYPSILDYDLQPIDTSEWSFTNATTITTKEDDFFYRPLLAALFGRNYDLDLEH